MNHHQDNMMQGRDISEDREEVIGQLVTIRDYLRWGVSLMVQRDVFFGHGTDNAWDECLALLQAALYWPQPLEPNVLDARLLPAERGRVIDWLVQRVEQRVPLPYLTGQAWFAELLFDIDRRAIIPRSPLAELIEVGFEPWYQGAGIHRVLDLCTGSGCIGIACARWLPDCTVDLVDIAADVLTLAQQNIVRHDVVQRVSPWRSDLFDALPAQRYDVIVSNPPYVDAGDLASMPAEFHHEPALALAAGDDGLHLAKRILYQAVDYLAADGLLLLEVGNSAEALQAQYPELPFTWVELARGGDGVLVASAAELAQWHQRFAP
jgi:ribosomal protein L3 glutamine methyltransferase